MSYRSRTGDSPNPNSPQETRGDEDNPAFYGETMAYPGFVAQQYVRPGTVSLGMIQELKDECDQVENNTLRGGYSHGRLENSHVGPRDSERAVGEIVNPSDNVDQIYPGKTMPESMPPLPVKIVNQYPIEETRLFVDVYQFNSNSTATGTPAANGLTRVAILNKDIQRTRALISVTNLQGGSIPVIVPRGGLPANGFPIPAATTTFLELFTTDEVFVSGSASTDVFTVTVLIERKVNADPRHAS